MSASRLRHYSGGAVVHHYLDHRTGKLKRQTLSQEEMIGRYISPVPAPHFKRVRYSGFLANCKRGALLPKVYSALEMTTRKNRISRIRGADEGLCGYGSIQMHSLR